MIVVDRAAVQHRHRHALNVAEVTARFVSHPRWRSIAERSTTINVATLPATSVSR